jgi:hypothetical protein
VPDARYLRAKGVAWSSNSAFKSAVLNARTGTTSAYTIDRSRCVVQMTVLVIGKLPRQPEW